MALGFGLPLFHIELMRALPYDYTPRARELDHVLTQGQEGVAVSPCKSKLHFTALQVRPVTRVLRRRGFPFS